MTYTTKWDESRVLDYFWTAARDPEVDRERLLKQLSDVAIERPREWDRTAVRLAMAGVKIKLFGDRCFMCRNREWWIVWHHVIQVQHGGSSAPRNVVPLCKPCHKRVHPWLAPLSSRDRRFGWTSIGDVALYTLKTLTDAWGSRTTIKMKRPGNYEWRK